MNRKRCFVSLLFSLSFALAQNAPSGPPPAPQNFQPNSALVVEGIPPVPASIAQQADRYTQVRAAAFLDCIEIGDVDLFECVKLRNAGKHVVG